MLSVILLAAPPSTAGGDAATRDIAKTLAALVPFVVGNLLADALLVTIPGWDLDAIEQRSGCTVIEDASMREGVLRAVGAARRETILTMEPGYSLPPSFGDEIVEALGTAPTQARYVNPVPARLAERLLPRLLAPVALIAPAKALTEAVRTVPTSLPTLVRATGAKPLRTTATRA